MTIRRPVMALAALLLSAASFASFRSPEGHWAVDVDLGTNAKGTDVKPMKAQFYPQAPEGGTTIHASFQLIRYSDPSADTVKDAMHWPPGEAAVALENRSTTTDFGFRIISLKESQPWRTRDIVASQVQWVDATRLVYRGNSLDSERFYIGVFNARTGKTRVAHADLSGYTSYDVTGFDETSIFFHEQTRGVDDDRCYSFNTETGKRTTRKCRP